MIGRTLGHYVITEQIGSGGMGAVYRARDERLERDVAIKVLHSQGANEDAKRLMRHEALALSRITHPNIATVHELGAEGDVDFIVMEFIPGDNLNQRLEAGTLTENEVIRIGRGLADGLDAAHRNGVIHRDLKPSNVRITPDGHVKILDFGIARRTASAETRTHRGPVLGGTLPYLAPEIVNGQDADARSDIYAAGAVLYEMATGRRAHPGRSDAEVLNAILNRVPTLPDTGVTVSAELQSVILKALDKNPDRRYQSARELAIDLARLGDPSTPRQLMPAHRDSGWPGRWIAVAVAAAAIVLAIAMGWPRLTTRTLPTSTNTSAPIKLAVMPTQLVATTSSPAEWQSLVQTLFADQFTGVTDLGVVDSLSLNSLIGFSPAAQTRTAVALERERLIASGIRLGLESQVVSAPGGFELRAAVVDLTAGEQRFSDHAAFKDESTLASAVASIADNVVTYLHVDVLGGSRNAVLRPWLAFRNRNIQAVGAFLQANDYILHYQTREGEKYLRRAIELDPDYTAPRIFLIGGLLQRGQRADAEEQMRHLLAAEPNASPFEQAMIRYAAARMRDDTEQMMRQLEIALTFSPGNYILMMNLGGQRVQAGQCREALPLLDPLIASRWAYPPLFPLWGYCAVDAGRFGEAIEALKFAETVKPVDPGVYALLDVALTASHRPKEAAKYAAMRYPGGYATVIAQLCAQLASRALARQDSEMALTLMRKATEEAPQVARYYNELGAMLVTLGRMREAEKAYHDALKAEPGGKDADVAREQLNRIENASPPNNPPSRR